MYPAPEKQVMVFSSVSVLVEAYSSVSVLVKEWELVLNHQM